MPLSPRHSRRQALATAGRPAALRDIGPADVQRQAAQRGGRGQRRTPVSTPRRSTHNRAGYGQNQDYDFSFSQLGFDGGEEESEETELQTMEEQIASFVEDRSTFGDWKPSISIGSPLSLPEEDLSRIQLADRHIAQWRLILEYQDGASHIQKILDERIKERLALDENDEENTLPMSVASTRQIAQTQVAEQTAVQRSSPPTERLSRRA